MEAHLSSLLQRQATSVFCVSAMRAQSRWVPVPPQAGFILSATKGRNDEVDGALGNKSCTGGWRLIQRVTKQGLRRDQETAGGPRESAGAQA